MTTSPAPRPQRSTEAARAACQVVELLGVLWERGRDTAAPSTVSASQLRVMYSLEHDEGINLRRLGHLLGAAPSSVSRLCDRLEALGFVERTPSPVSRRELTLRLTQRGKSHLAELRSRREEMLLAPIGAMTPAARSALLEGLHDFRDALRATEQVRTGPARADPDREHGPSTRSSRSA